MKKVKKSRMSTAKDKHFGILRDSHQYFEDKLTYWEKYREIRIDLIKDFIIVLKE